MTTPAKIILRIPGPWPERIDIITSVARSRTGYLFADDLVYNTRTLQTFPTLVGGFLPEMEVAFTSFSTGNIDEQTLEAIRKHVHSLYFTTPAYTPHDARAAMRAADALLISGGIAILVESSGVVHTAPQWHALYTRSDTDNSALYEAFVSRMFDRPNRTYYTCGMHNMGKRDAILTGNLIAVNAPALVRHFLLHTLATEDEIEPAHTFSATDDHPAYKVTPEPCATFPAGNVYHNPHGMWRLETLPT
ncbi:MAG: hypothetical protein WCD37_17400 [Chloroflexia bacterium]